MTFSDLPHVVPAGIGLDTPLGRLGAVHKIRSELTEGRLAILEHSLPARTLAAPLHRHAREDELAIVLAGSLGAQLGDDAIRVGAGSYVFKPRGQWHTFWNAGDDELRFIQLLIPGGSEGYYARLSPMITEAFAPTRRVVQSIAAEYGIEFDFDSVRVLCTRHGLTVS